VPALARSEPQHAGDRVEHLDARIDRPALLEPGVPGDADAGELRHLFAAQARSAPPAAGCDADLGRGDALAAAAQEGGELFAPSLAVRPRNHVHQ
jgi:hypothetical protein